MRAVRIAAWVLLAVVLVTAAGLGVFVATFDKEAAVARLQAQVRRATGWSLTVAGPVRFRPAWPPEVTAERVALSGPPGPGRPATVTVDQVRAGVALRPLLSGQAELDVVLVRPDLEVDRDTLRFTPEPAQAATPAGPSRAPWFRAELRRLHVEDGRIGFPAEGRGTVGVPAATVVRGSDGGVTVHARIEAQGRKFALSGTAGPALRPLHAQLDDPIEAGDLRLGALTLDAMAPGEPVRVRAELAVRGLPVSVDVAAIPAEGPGGGVGGGLGAPVHIDLTAASAGATLSASGNLDPKAASGFDATVSARVPDLAALSPIAGTPLPALGAVALDGRFLLSAGTPGVAMRSLRVQAGPGNLAGDVALRWSGPPGLRGTLTSNRLDVDAILAALPHPAPPPAPATPGPAAPVPAPPAPASASPPVRLIPGRLIPHRPIDLAVLEAIDVDLTANLTNVTLAGQAIPGVDAHLTAGNGRARLDPLVLTSAGGRVTGTLAIDGTATPPAWSLDVSAPELRLDRLTDAVHGAADLDASLTATGGTTGALAASLDGRASLRLLNGDIDDKLLAPLLAAPLRAAHVDLDLSGRSAVRCLLVPLTAAHGTVSTQGLLLDTSRVRVEGEGTADLATETLAVQLRPTLLLGGGASVEAPVRVSGSFVHPEVALGDASGRTGLRIGLGAHHTDPDACGPEASAPEPSGPGPADVHPAGKAAGLLRSLLR